MSRTDWPNNPRYYCDLAPPLRHGRERFDTGVMSVDGYDIYTCQFRADPHSFYRTLRGQRSPVAYSDRWGGSWMLSTFADIRGAARDPDRFSSRATEVAGPASAAGGLYLPPLTSDPSHHPRDRQILTRFLSAARVADMEPFIRAHASRLIDRLSSAGHGDLLTDFARPLALAVLGDLLGVADTDRLSTWIVTMTRSGAQDQKVRAWVAGEMATFIEALLRDRPERPGFGEDLAGYLLSEGLRGNELGWRYMVGVATLVVLAAADTTWSALGAALWHLGSYAEDRQQLAGSSGEPIRQAVEEFLRFYAPVTVGRRVVRETVLHGRRIAVGDRVLLPFAAANRDPTIFPDAEHFRLDRTHIRHLTFGSGAHHCPGAALVRLEMRVAIEELLRRIPMFCLAPTSGLTWSAGQVRGPQTVPVVLAG